MDFGVLESLPQTDMLRVVVTLWAIRYARRKAIHEDSFQSPFSTHCFINKFIEDMEVIKPADAKAQAPQRPPARWIPPPEGLVKIDVDAAMAKSLGQVAAAAIARDGTGVFIGASVLVLDGISDPVIVEAIACREGLASASDIVLQNFRLSCDNISVVRGINGGSMGLYGQVVKEIKERPRDFRITEFVHETRTSNVDAHNLARSSVLFCYW